MKLILKQTFASLKQIVNSRLIDNLNCKTGWVAFFDSATVKPRTKAAAPHELQMMLYAMCTYLRLPFWVLGCEYINVNKEK